MRASIFGVLATALLAAAQTACSAADSITPGCPTADGCGVDTTTLAPTNVATGWVAKTLVDNGTTFKYQVFVPPAYNPSTTRIPVILFMHGSGEQGTDGVKQ